MIIRFSDQEVQCLNAEYCSIFNEIYPFRLEGGELLKRILSMEAWLEGDASSYLNQLCEAVEYLHQPSRRIVHADIRVSLFSCFAYVNSPKYSPK